MDRWVVVSIVLHVFVGALAFILSGTPRAVESAQTIEVYLAPQPPVLAETPEVEGHEEASVEEPLEEPEPTPPAPDPDPTRPPAPKPTRVQRRLPEQPAPRPKSTPVPPPQPKVDRREVLRREILKRKLESMKSRREEVSIPATRPIQPSTAQSSSSSLSSAQISALEEQYGGKVYAAIHREWIIPTRQGGTLRECQVRITIQKNGRISGTEVLRRSRDPRFDSSVLTAIGKARIDPIPDDLEKNQINVTIWFKDRS